MYCCAAGRAPSVAHEANEEPAITAAVPIEDLEIKSLLFMIPEFN
jgi:hypothetical protein